jgi:hypothetical protein
MRGAPSSSHRQDNFSPHFDFDNSFLQQQQQQQQQGPSPFPQSVGAGGWEANITDQQVKAWEASKKRVNFGIMSAVKGAAKVLPAQFRLDREGVRLHAERQKRLMMAKLEEEKRHTERVRVREERRMESVRLREAKRWERQQERAVEKARVDEQRRIDYAAGFRHSSEDESASSINSHSSDGTARGEHAFSVRAMRNVSGVLAPVLPVSMRSDKEGRRLYRERQRRDKSLRKAKRQRQRDRDKRFRERCRERERRRDARLQLDEQKRQQRRARWEEARAAALSKTVGAGVAGFGSDLTFEFKDEEEDDMFAAVRGSDSASVSRSDDSLSEDEGVKGVLAGLTMWLPAEMRLDKEGRELASERRRTLRQESRERARRNRNRQREKSLKLRRKEKMKREKIRAAAAANELAERRRQERLEEGLGIDIGDAAEEAVAMATALEMAADGSHSDSTLSEGDSDSIEPPKTAWEYMKHLTKVLPKPMRFDEKSLAQARKKMRLKMRLKRAAKSRMKERKARYSERVAHKQAVLDARSAQRDRAVAEHKVPPPLGSCLDSLTNINVSFPCQPVSCY